MNATTLLSIPLALALAGCVVVTHTGPLQHDAVSIPRDSSEFLRATITMGAGNLRVFPGATGFLDGDMTYNLPSWKPVVQYSAAAGHGNLDVSQPGLGHGPEGNAKSEWDLHFANDIPLDLSVHFGAGDAHLDLGSLFLRSVDLEMGVGQLDMDLRGAARRDYGVRIRGGVGEATIHLPHDAGVYAKVQGGIGSINSSGLRHEGDHLVNDAYDHSKVSIRLDVQGGIGTINLLAD